ncbi:MAG: hypothetical protein JNJ54_12775 [Myxococcaceae bacterium]|nr:hypothetical protein [Myxococcaceae bacterium]
MKTWLAVVVTFGLLGCGPALPECVCQVATLSGTKEVSCGGALCDGVDGFRCSATGVLSRALDVCGGQQQQQPAPTCTRRTCMGLCGTASDGCGGTLQCGGCGAGEKCGPSSQCEPLCANVTCPGTQRCEPATGQCIADACSQAGAICGVVNGQTCGACPQGSTCSAARTTCIEAVATLPAQYVHSVALIGAQLYVTSTASLNQSARDLSAIDLSTKQVRPLASNVVLSPLATANGSLLWGEAMGLRRLEQSATQPVTIAGLDSGCSDLVVMGAFAYCSVGGNARYGVSSFGIKKLPLAGGTATFVKSYLNYARLAAVAPYLFYVGTTDNQYSFKTLGAVDSRDGTDQVVLSGGVLDSGFVLADPDAYYFVEYGNSTATLGRVPFDATTTTPLVSGTGFRRDTTVLRAGELFTVAKVGTQEGLWRIPLAAPSSRSLVLTSTDLQWTANGGPSHVLANGSGWLFVSGATVYRTVTPNQ